MTWDDLLTFRDFYKLILDYAGGNEIGQRQERVFQTFRLPERFASYATSRRFNTMDEIDRSIRPRWKRMLPAFISRHL